MHYNKISILKSKFITSLLIFPSLYGPRLIKIITSWWKAIALKYLSSCKLFSNIPQMCTGLQNLPCKTVQVLASNSPSPSVFMIHYRDIGPLLSFSSKFLVTVSVNLTLFFILMTLKWKIKVKQDSQLIQKTDCVVHYFGIESVHLSSRCINANEEEWLH